MYALCLYKYLDRANGSFVVLRKRLLIYTGEERNIPNERESSSFNSFRVYGLKSMFGMEKIYVLQTQIFKEIQHKFSIKDVRVLMMSN